MRERKSVQEKKRGYNTSLKERERKKKRWGDSEKKKDKRKFEGTRGKEIQKEYVQEREKKRK